MAQDKYVIQDEAMPQNTTVGHQIFDGIVAELGKLINVPENWGPAIQGAVDKQNKFLSNKVANVLNLTNRAFDNLQSANAMANYQIQLGVGDMTTESQNAAGTVTDAPVSWSNH
ncbi:MAG: hypothetical protein Q4G64_05560 [bacterium]|nr:hypothetical protein [bacterium]